MENKIRLAKPMLQAMDGPFLRINAWLKQFYSKPKPMMLKAHSGTANGNVNGNESAAFETPFRDGSEERQERSVDSCSCSVGTVKGYRNEW